VAVVATPRASLAEAIRRPTSVSPYRYSEDILDAHCPLCDQEHDALPLVFGADAPWRLFVPEEEFAERVALEPNLCVIDKKYFFVRGHIQLPIEGHDEPFTWSVWCSVSQDSFGRMMDSWNDPERVNGEPYFGWLNTSLPMYEQETLHMKTMLHERGPGTVPLVVLEPTDHPLAVEQREGIAMKRVHHIARTLTGKG
jgi:hypothetical protein